MNGSCCGILSLLFSEACDCNWACLFAGFNLVPIIIVAAAAFGMDTNWFLIYICEIQILSSVMLVCGGNSTRYLDEVVFYIFFV